MSNINVVKLKKSHQSVCVHQWGPYTKTKTARHAQLSVPVGIPMAYQMQHNICHIRRGRNIRYSNRVVQMQKHPVMVKYGEIQ